MMERINARGWPFEDVLAATGLIRGVADVFAEDTLTALIAPELPMPTWALSGDRLSEWVGALDNLGDPERERFLETIQLVIEVGRRMIDGLDQVIVNSGLSGSVPDTVPEEWNSEPPADLAGDCVATAYDRCPACGDPIDYCQGHGEIGDPDGYAILQAHDNEDHSDCVKVRDVKGEVE